jgi:hypothetical protein
MAFEMHDCVDFAENALFSSNGVICSWPLPSTLSGGLIILDGQNEQQ